MMIFSPSLWISEEIYKRAKSFTPAGPTDIYLYAGGMESANHYGQVLRLDSILQEKENMMILISFFSQSIRTT